MPSKACFLSPAYVPKEDMDSHLGCTARKKGQPTEIRRKETPVSNRTISLQPPTTNASELVDQVNQRSPLTTHSWLVDRTPASTNNALDHPLFLDQSVGRPSAEINFNLSSAEQRVILANSLAACTFILAPLPGGLGLDAAVGNLDAPQEKSGSVGN